MVEDSPNQGRRFPRRRAIMAAAAVATLLAGAWAGRWLPDAGLRWGLQEALTRLGLAEFSLSDADLSLFNGRIVLHRMVARPKGGPAGIGLDGLDVDFRWEPLFHRKVAAERVTLNGLDIEVRRAGQGWAVAGLPLAVGGTADGDRPWTFEIDTFALRGGTLTLVDGDTRLRMEVAELAVENLRSAQPEAPLRFALKGKVNGAPLTLTGTATPFAAIPEFHLTAATEHFDLSLLGASLGAAGQVSGRLAIGGRVEGAGVAATATGEVEAKGLSRPEGGAETVSLSLRKAEWRDRRLTAAGTLAATGLTSGLAGSGLTAASVRAEATELQWEENRARGTGTVTVEGAKAALGGFEFTQRKASAEGRVEFGGGDWPVAALKVTAEGLLLREPERDWLAAERLDIPELQFDAAGRLTLPRLTGRTVAALKGAGYPWRVEIKDLRAARLAYHLGSGEAAAGELSASGATLRLTRDKGGILGLPELGGGEAGRGETPPWSLGRLTLAGARLLVEDRTPPQPVRLEFKPLEASIAGLDSAQPDRDSPWSVRAAAGEARLAASGTARPLAAEPTGRLQAEVDHFELPPLSPYAAAALGVELGTGQVDGKAELAIAKGALDGKVELVLSEFYLDQPAPDAAIARKVDMPIETVLDLLRDGDERIRLTVPVGGNLADPQFDVSDAVGQAIAGALKSTAVTTLKVVFPVAALVSLVIDAENNKRLSLAPLEFRPGSDELDDIGRLAAVAELMKGRPGLKLKLCGKAVAADWPELAAARRAEEQPLLAKLQKLLGVEKTAVAALPPDRDALAELAARRSGAAKAWLADQAVEPGRLFECRPEVEADGKPARVELLL